MATQETQKIDSIIASRRALLATGGAALAGLALTTMGTGKAEAQAAVTDNDILNFALNLEYLEANFYQLAVTGQTIDQIGIGVGAGTTATGTVSVVTKPGGPTACKVPFQIPGIQAYAIETSVEEGHHVSFLRSALGTNAVAQPSLDLYNSFNALAQLVGLTAFDPFANDLTFLIGAYIFEDVGVTAYHGAAPLISDKTVVLPAAVGIHAVEAYHAGLVRNTIYQFDPTDSQGFLTLTQQISAARAYLDGTGPAPVVSQKVSSIAKLKKVQRHDTTTTVDDYGVTLLNVALNSSSAMYTSTTIADADPTNFLCFGRSTTQVLNIVYGDTTTTPGGFFPAGMNGTIK